MEEEIDYCAVCDKPLGYLVPMCCNGYMCGCMGMPTEPPVCSTECEEKYMERIRNGSTSVHEIPDIFDF